MSFTKAAEDLFITQPAVTNQIKTFEENLNLKLFKKNPRKICLSEEGKILYEYAQKLFNYEKEIEKVIEDIKELRVGAVSVGTTRTYAHSFLPLLITHFHKSYPNIKVKVDEGGSLDIIQNLFSFKNDVAIIAKVEDNRDVCFIPFCREELLVILPPDHRFKEKKVISIADLREEKIIMRGKGSGTHRIVNDLFEISKFTPHILSEAGDTELIKNMVQKGEGISFLSKQSVSTEIDEKKLIAAPLEGNQIFLDINIAYLKNHILSPPAIAFLDILGQLVARGKPIEGVSSLIVKLIAHGINKL
jgi:DNA-binding transcriptional LysR family regulator